MAGPFDLITGALGQANPYDEARAYQARQTAQNNAALGLAPDGSPMPAPANGAPLPTTKGPTPAITQPPQAQPDATKTPQDLGSIMLDLQQYNERNQGFNQAMGMGFAAFAQPRDRQMVSQMFNVNQSDPTKIGSMLMNLNSQQQGQNRANRIAQMVNDPIQGPQIARSLHMDWEALKAGIVTDPGMVGKVAEALGTPTEKLRDLTQVGQMGGAGAPGGAVGKGPLGDVGTQIVSGIGGNAAMPETI